MPACSQAIRSQRQNDRSYKSSHVDSTETSQNTRTISHLHLFLTVKKPFPEASWHIFPCAHWPKQCHMTVPTTGKWKRMPVLVRTIQIIPPSRGIGNTEHETHPEEIPAFLSRKKAMPTGRTTNSFYLTYHLHPNSPHNGDYDASAKHGTN